MKHAAALILPMLLPLIAPAQQTPPPPQAAPPAVAESPEIREQSIYIPYRKLWEVFEQEGRGVFLPYEQFQELWKARLEQLPAAEESRPPVGARLAALDGIARVGEDAVSFEAVLRIELLEPGWHEVPLRLADVAVTEALLGDQPARLLYTEADGYRLLLHHEGAQPASTTLTLRFAKAYDKQAGLNAVSFQSPQAPVSRWDIRIPEAGVKVSTIQPLLAATEVAGEDPNETRVLAFVGAAPLVHFQWTPRQEGATGLEALLELTTEQRVSILEGVTRTTANLTFTISRVEQDSLAFRVPADHKVVNVLDPNIREWTATPVDADRQEVEVRLFQPVKGPQTMQVTLERYGETNTIRAPVIEGRGVGRQQGVVAVDHGSSLRATILRREGVFQIDRADLPGMLASPQPAFAFRYLSTPFELVMQVDPVQPRILVDTLAEASLSPEELVTRVAVTYDIQRAGVFELRLSLPDGADVREVEGHGLAGATPAQVERHFIEDAEDGERRLVVTLSARAEGLVGLWILLRHRLEEPDLLAATGNAVVVPIPVPRPVGDEIARRRGHVVVYGPESLLLNAFEPVAVRQVSVNEARQGLDPLTPDNTGRAVMAYAFDDTPPQLAVSAERRAPQVTFRQFLVAAIQGGVAQFTATFTYDVRFSGIEAARFALPASLADSVRLTTPGLRREVEPAEADAADRVVWSVRGESEFLGEGQIQFRWEYPLDQLEVGQRRELPIARIEPLGATRAWGQIALTKTEGIDLTPTGEQRGLRPIDPRYDLAPGATVEEGALAFEFHDAWALSVYATRYEPKEVKTSSIERGLVRMVLTRGKQTGVQALYRVSSVRQRLVIELPPDVQFDSQPLRIDGRPAALEKGEGDRYFVPLVGVDPGRPFLLELRYVLPQKGWKLRGPEFPDEPAIQQVFLSVYLPREYAFLGSAGPWDDEIRWRMRGFNLRPDARRSDEALFQWVGAGLPVGQDVLESFPTDGNHLCFSTLRPPAGKGGRLKLRVVRYGFLHTVVLGIILWIGVRHRATPLARRAVVIGGWLVVLLVVSVFAPSLIRSLVNNAAVAAGLVVLILWVLWYLLVLLPQSPVAEAFREAAAERHRRQAELPPELPSPPKKGRRASAKPAAEESSDD
jgi:hypothetical protein